MFSKWAHSETNSPSRIERIETHAVPSARSCSILSHTISWEIEGSRMGRPGGANLCDKSQGGQNEASHRQIQ